jgi:hypothetical protein
MDISAALTDDEVALLSVSERSCETATRWSSSGEAQQNASLADGTFEECLRLKNTLDAVEIQGTLIRLYALAILKLAR